MEKTMKKLLILLSLCGMAHADGWIQNPKITPADRSCVSFGIIRCVDNQNITATDEVTGGTRQWCIDNAGGSGDYELLPQPVINAKACQ